ncbi:hypothetical protein F1559_004343 [Cyanidiococcus yangmingshanensis]|uniref:Uncharacterized protein n=1 Tax=Cyanidiococcus yangmingshanensis TaxID=2690220 RepID=A0A7J7IJV6_9RHOD|nr:hypothetical protein F1559_004343 [Cyanidiococcus yangmingshanensis]
MVQRPIGWRWTQTSSRWLGLVRGNFFPTFDGNRERNDASLSNPGPAADVVAAYRAKEVVFFRLSDGKTVRRLVAEELGLGHSEQLVGALCARGHNRDALLLLCNPDHGPCDAHPARLLEVDLGAPTETPIIHAIALNKSLERHATPSTTQRSVTTTLGAAFAPVVSAETLVSALHSASGSACPRQGKRSHRRGPCFLHQALIVECGQAPLVLTLLTSAISAPFRFEWAMILQNEELERAWPWASRLGWPRARACALFGCTCSVCSRPERQSSRIITALVLYDRIVGVLCWRCSSPNELIDSNHDVVNAWVQFLRPLPAWMALYSTTSEQRLTEEIPWPAISRHESGPYRGHFPDLKVDEMLVCGGRMSWTVANWRLEIPTRLETDVGTSALVTLRWLQLSTCSPPGTAVVSLDGCVDSFRFRDLQNHARLVVAYADGLVLDLECRSPPSVETFWQQHEQERLNQLQPLEQLLGFINAHLLMTTFGRQIALASASDHGSLQASLVEPTLGLNLAAATDWSPERNASETVTAAVAFGRSPVAVNDTETPSPARVSYLRALWSPDKGAILESIQYGVVMSQMLEKQLATRGRPTRLFVLEREAVTMIFVSSDWPERCTQMLRMNYLGGQFQIESDVERSPFCRDDGTVAVHHWARWSEAIQVCGRKFVLLRWHHHSWLGMHTERSEHLIDAFATDDERLFALGHGRVLSVWMRHVSVAPCWYPYVSLVLDAPVATLMLNHESLKVLCWTRDSWLEVPLQWRSRTEVYFASASRSVDLEVHTAARHEGGKESRERDAGPVRSLVRVRMNKRVLEMLGFANGRLLINGNMSVQLGFADLQLRRCVSSTETPLDVSDRCPSEEAQLVAQQHGNDLEAQVLFLVDGQVWLGVSTTHCNALMEPQSLTLWPVIWSTGQSTALLDCHPLASALFSTSSEEHAPSAVPAPTHLPLLWLDADATLHLGLIDLSLRAHCIRRGAGTQPMTILAYDEQTASVWTLLDGRPVALEPETLKPRVIHDTQGVLTDDFVDLSIAPGTRTNLKASIERPDQPADDRHLIAFQSARRVVYLAEAQLHSTEVWLIAHAICPGTQDPSLEPEHPFGEEERVRLATSLVPQTILLSIERPRGLIFEAWTGTSISSFMSQTGQRLEPRRLARLTLTGMDTFRLDPWSRPPVLVGVSPPDSMNLSGMYADAPDSNPFQPGQHVELWQPNGSNRLHVIRYGQQRRVRLDVHGLVEDTLVEEATRPRWQRVRGPWSWPQGQVPCAYHLDVPQAGLVLVSGGADPQRLNKSETHWVTFADGACLVWVPERLEGGDC